MKLGVLTAATAALLIAASSSAAFAGQRGEVVDGGARLRDGPGTYSDTIAYLDGGTKVWVKYCRDSGWCKVRYDGIRGWIAKSRLALEYSGRPGEDPTIETIDPNGNGGSDPGTDPAVDPGCDSPDGDCGYVKILGRVVDKPGYCYALAKDGRSIIVRCP